MNRILSHISLLLLGLVVLSTSSCSDNAAIPAFEVTLESNFTIPIDQVALFVQGTATDPDRPSFIDANLSVAQMGKNQITSIQPGSAILRSKFNNENLGFLRDVSVRAVKKDNSGIVKELFYLTDIRLDEGNSMVLFPALTEIKDIMTDPTFDLQLVVNFQGFPSSNVTLELDYTYLVFDE